MSAVTKQSELQSQYPSDPANRGRNTEGIPTMNASLAQVSLLNKSLQVDGRKTAHPPGFKMVSQKLQYGDYIPPEVEQALRNEKIQENTRVYQSISRVNHTDASS